MSGGCPNLYQRARKESPYTQEQAAQRLFCSEKTVKAWEQGARTPDNTTVARMAEIYGTPWLKLERLLEVFAELEIYEDDGLTRTLPSAVLTQWDLTNDLIDGYRRLIQITADGRIDESEEADYRSICDIILRNCVAGLKVVFGPEEPQGIKKERPDGGTSRRSVQGLRREQSQDDYSTLPARLASPSFSRRGGVSL